MRKAAIKIHDVLAGWLTEDENGYHFVYDSGYRQMEAPFSVSLTLPIQAND